MRYDLYIFIKRILSSRLQKNSFLVSCFYSIKIILDHKRKKMINFENQE